QAFDRAQGFSSSLASLTNVFPYSRPPRGRFGLGEVQHLDVLLSGYRGLGEPRSGNGVPNLQRREAYGCAIGLLFEPYPRQICVCGSEKDLQMQTVLEIPGRVVAVKLRHDAHLSASSHLFGMPGLWKARGDLCIFQYNI
ncbi:hypothetical protein EVAR_73370_1, partial [Eumeta japonica]